MHNEPEWKTSAASRNVSWWIGASRLSPFHSNWATIQFKKKKKKISRKIVAIADDRITWKMYQCDAIMPSNMCGAEDDATRAPVWIVRIICMQMHSHDARNIASCTVRCLALPSFCSQMMAHWHKNFDWIIYSFYRVTAIDMKITKIE